jgi:hypothetical protein
MCAARKVPASIRLHLPSASSGAHRAFVRRRYHAAMGLHASGAGAPGDASGLPKSAGPRCITRFAPADAPWSIAATGRWRMGMRAGRRAARGRPMDRAPVRRHPGTSARGHFAGTPTRSLHARGAGAPGDTSGCPITRFAARGPLPPPTARCPSPRPPARGWAMRAVRRALASMIGARPVGGWRTIFVPVTQERRRAPLRRDVDAQPARPRRRCAGRYFRVASRF